MTAPHMAWVMKHSDALEIASSGEYVVLLAVAFSYDQAGTCAFPSIKTVCAHTGLSVRVVQTHLRALQARGIITIEAQEGRSSNRYTIVGMPPSGVYPERKAAPSGSATPAVDSTHDADSTPAVDSTPPVLHTAPTPAADSTPPLLPTAPLLIGIERDSERVIERVERTVRAGVRARGRDAPDATVVPLRALVAAQTPATPWDTFEEWWRAVLGVYPKQGKVDLHSAKDWARDGIPPADWERVYQAACNLRDSDRTRRGYIRNLLSFLQGDSWQAFEDGPIGPAASAPENPSKFSGHTGIAPSNGRVSYMRHFMEQAGMARGHYENGRIAKGGGDIDGED